MMMLSLPSVKTDGKRSTAKDRRQNDPSKGILLIFSQEIHSDDPDKKDQA
jgi:hypothetical protein